ncbi:MAG: DUF222 domain-containing protein [Candidatus Nanopelagicales bacterium]
MSSTTDGTRTPITVAGLARLVDDARTATRAVASALAQDPTLLAEVPDELLETFTLALHQAADASTAAATVVTGRLERQVGSVRGKLIAGRYPTTARFLQVEAGMTTPQARATVARGRDLDTHSTRVGDAWLFGDIPGGAVRDLTVGVTEVLRRSTRTDTPVARGEALDILLPLAQHGDPDRLHRAIGELRLRIDPEGTTDEALFAFENQTLSIVDAGTMWRISGWLSPEAAIATRAVLEAGARQISEQALAGLDHDVDCEHTLDKGEDCSCGATDRAKRSAGMRQDHLHARALGEFMTGKLDDATLGSHHRVAPHITVVVDTTDATAPLIGRMAVPGQDGDVLLGEASVNRLLCDADVTRVLTTAATAATPAPSSETASTTTVEDDEISDATTTDTANAYLAAVVTTLEAMARSVLYVGRHERTISARLRRALEIRDGHCVFPGCRARVARCHAHHVQHWKDDGPTDLPNLALLCVTHHVAVHEGGWTLALKPGATGHERGCWQFTPPPPKTRTRRP